MGITRGLLRRTLARPQPNSPGGQTGSLRLRPGGPARSARMPPPAAAAAASRWGRCRRPRKVVRPRSRRWCAAAAAAAGGSGDDLELEAVRSVAGPGRFERLDRGDDRVPVSRWPTWPRTVGQSTLVRCCCEQF